MIKLRYGQDKYSVPADAQFLSMAYADNKNYFIFPNKLAVLLNAGHYNIQYYKTLPVLFVNKPPDSVNQF